MNNSVHVMWGSPGLSPAGVSTVAQNEKEGVDVSYAHMIHPETVHPLAEEGKQLRDCLKKKKKKKPVINLNGFLVLSSQVRV